MAQSFTIAGEEYQLVESKFTFAEAKAIEAFSGYSFAELMQDEKLRSRTAVVQAMLWVSMKRVNPTLQFGELEDVAIDDIEWGEPEEVPEPANPTEGDSLASQNSD